MTSSIGVESGQQRQVRRVPGRQRHGSLSLGERRQAVAVQQPQCARGALQQLRLLRP